jgi:hypothetical protein
MAKKKPQQTDEQKLLDEVKTRFKRCEDFESNARKLWREDLRFANGDPDNGWQWDDAMRKSRQLDGRPHLTINKVKQHNRQITNDARQNKPSVRVSPVDSGADKKTAEIFNGIIRHIESNSSADVAYDTAQEFAVDAGLGYWRITTDYASYDSFDQEIFIKRVKNPLNVYLDPYIQEADGSDARYGFVFEELPKDEFEANYPNADAVSWPTDINSTTEWLTKDTIRIAEYFRKVDVNDTLYADEQGNTMLASELEPEMAKAAKASGLRSRTVKTCKVEWYLIAGGEQILEQKEWPGVYIPLVRVVGDEVEIDGEIDRKGHTRQMKDAQRMYNYWTSSAVEFVALQGKQPYLTPAEAVEGYEEYWDNLNTSNTPYLPYNAFTEDGNPLPMPQRQQPPTMASAYMQGMQVASEEMKMASGQYDASMGAKSNETSGRAIMARQREGDTSTFHFVDNVARAIKYTGKILVDLIPKIYDTARVIRIIGEDGKEDKVQIDPSQQAAYSKQQNPLTREVEEIYNPSVGRYDVTVTVGPSYTSKRQEAFQALTEMSSRNPQLLQVAGDLIMKAADFPMADQLAERLEKTLPPNIKDDDEQQLPPQAKAQIDHLTQTVQQMDGAIQNMQSELESKEIEKYKAQTDRMKVEGDLALKAQAQQATPSELLMEFAAVKEMLIDVMQGVKNPAHLDALPSPQEMQPPQEQAQPDNPPSAGFLTPNESQ